MVSNHSSPTRMEDESLLLGGPGEDSATDAQVKLEDGGSKPTPPGPDITLEPMPSPKDEDDKPALENQMPKAEASMSPPTSSKPVSPGPQLIGDLPRAETEALRTFVEISENHYQYGTLGRSREALESMMCDCQYEHGLDPPNHACGHNSDCINRLTQVECLAEDCRCRSYCQNQRFQQKEYADIEIVQTEKKGFGLRAGKDLRKDSFIYEYVGEVVNQPSFKKRMREYASEGIRHFYFMMLQKDEFIDATKRGGKGRFANHSCSPNCYVAKWTVGHHVRMGIFANRNIRKDEELTFNYNVDRYGHDAQPCYCGEPKCVGFIGGKTQTDIAGMDDLCLEALGITDEVEMLGLKGNKKKKGKKLDEDWVPILKPIVEKDIPKVVQAVRQTQSRKVLFKLLTRIKITEDHSALRQLMRLRGFSLMTNILDDYAKDMEITALVLECLTAWPLLQRNKVDDSKITVPVKVCSESENEVVKTMAQKLLDYWDTLESGYRIPKRMKQDGGEEDDAKSPVIVYENDDAEARPSKRSRYEDLLSEASKFELKPVSQPSPRTTTKVDASPKPGTSRVPTRDDIAKIIEKAAAAAAAAKPEPTPTKDGSLSKKKLKEKKHQTPEEKEANKEKRLQKLVGAVVVKCMSKYQTKMDHDSFKKHAKELTQVISEKEKKSSSYKDGHLDSLSDEKVAKIKKFSKEYMRKLEKSNQRPKISASTSSGAALSATDASTSLPPEATPLPPEPTKGDPMDPSTTRAVKADTIDPRLRPPNGNETFSSANGACHNEHGEYLPMKSSTLGDSAPNALVASTTACTPPTDIIDLHAQPIRKTSLSYDVQMLPPFQVPLLWLNDSLLTNKPFLVEVRGSQGIGGYWKGEFEGRQGYIETVVDATAAFVPQESIPGLDTLLVPIHFLAPVPPSQNKDIVSPLDGPYKGVSLEVLSWGANECSVCVVGSTAIFDISTDLLGKLRQESNS